MAAIDQILRVDITESTQVVSQESFSNPLILGSTQIVGRDPKNLVRTYFGAEDLVADGYPAGCPEHRSAQAIFSQAIVPTLLKVGVRSGGQSVAQVDVVTIPSLQVGQDLSLTVNGQKAAHTVVDGETAQAALGALRLLIEAFGGVTGSVTGTGTSAKLTLTASNAGDLITYVPSAGLALVNQTAAKGIGADLAAVAEADPSWYGVTIPGASDAEILQAAAWIEANKKLFAAVSDTPAVADPSSTTDVASQTKLRGYNRTFVMYRTSDRLEGAEAAWLSKMIAQLPGSANWAFQNLAGIRADTLSPSAQVALIGVPVSGIAGKNANIYQTVSGASITEMGTAASGRYLDITHGLDWLQSKIKSNIYGQLVSAKKVPYTDVGVSVIISAVRSAIDEGVTNGMIDGTSPISVLAAPVASVPVNQRAQRIAPPVTFSCRQQGALNAVNIQGTVSV